MNGRGSYAAPGNDSTLHRRSEQRAREWHRGRQPAGDGKANGGV